MKQQKQKLVRKNADDEYYKGLEAEKEALEAERKEQEKIYGKLRKFQPQIDTCDNLINFLSALHPKVKAEEEAHAQVVYNADAVNDKLTSGDWKKEKVFFTYKIFL